jgi:hypothetical protein
MRFAQHLSMSSIRPDQSKVAVSRKSADQRTALRRSRCPGEQPEGQLYERRADSPHHRMAGRDQPTGYEKSSVQRIWAGMSFRRIGRVTSSYPSSPASGPSGRSLQTLSILWRRFDAVSRQAARLHGTRRQVVRQLGAEHLKNPSSQSGKKRGEPVSLLSKYHPRSPAVSAGGFSVVVSAHWTATGPWRF